MGSSNSNTCGKHKFTPAGLARKFCIDSRSNRGVRSVAADQLLPVTCRLQHRRKNTAITYSCCGSRSQGTTGMWL
ncbi:hypothetical protein C2845_PM01G24640 [Panicum miliaceum]|uniref:Uncharacterized protein n=1 Tax=Panicum miliaceum TaxID=4540 RepID=A0A3L6TH20_PANMI|nr:hypothetical protein C2845_PM01G24640 [Panicum miliaceum]